MNRRIITDQKLERGKKIQELENKLAKHPKRKYTVRTAEKLADDVLDAYGWDEKAGPVPIAKIAECFGIKVYSEPDISEEYSGNIYIGGTTKQLYNSNKVIIVGSNEEYYHQRFIAAHELAHYLMDYLGDNQWADETKLFSMAYPKTGHDLDEEIRADRFAAELLMPSKLFLKQYVRVMNAAMNDMKYVLPYLSKYFETKESSIERRIEETVYE